MHIDCLKQNSISGAIYDFADCLGPWHQEYLFYAFKSNRPTIGPRSHSPSFGTSYECDSDFNDAHDQIPWPDTTWAELACLPIRRRTRPGRAPQTIEALVCHAIYMCTLNSHLAHVPHPKAWLPYVSPQSGLRAAKIIVAHELRRFREDKGYSRYICINCHAGLV